MLASSLKYKMTGFGWLNVETNGIDDAVSKSGWDLVDCFGVIVVGCEFSMLTDLVLRYIIDVVTNFQAIYSNF